MTNESSLQERAINTRNALKTAFIEQLEQKGYLDTSIAEVANVANSSVGAFQNHFGTKKGALIAFWEGYCNQAAEELDAIKGQFLATSDFEVEEFLFYTSKALAELQEANIGLNQAMNVHFVTDRTIHHKTIEIMEPSERAMALLRPILWWCDLARNIGNGMRPSMQAMRRRFANKSLITNKLIYNNFM